MEDIYDGFLHGFVIGGIFALLTAISCSGCAVYSDMSEPVVEITTCTPPKPTCTKDPCDMDPQLACPDPGEGKDLYIRDYETCTCECTKKWIRP